MAAADNMHDKAENGAGKGPSANRPAGAAAKSAKDAPGGPDLKSGGGGQRPANLDFILDIPLEISVELGRTKMLIHDLLKLGQGSVIELTKSAGETLEIMANSRLIAKGDVVVMNDKYGIRLTEVISPVERLEKLK
jgi:flagellar motor switch protein FliN